MAGRSIHNIYNFSVFLSIFFSFFSSSNTTLCVLCFVILLRQIKENRKYVISCMVLFNNSTYLYAVLYYLWINIFFLNKIAIFHFDVVHKQIYIGSLVWYTDTQKALSSMYKIYTREPQSIMRSKKKVNMFYLLCKKIKNKT